MTTQNPVSLTLDGNVPADLRRRVDDALDSTLNKRRLNTDDHGAWQVLHGILAYKHDFPIRLGREGTETRAVDYLLNGGQLHGWTFHPGDLLDQATQRRGLRAVVEPGTKKGQGHSDQWLAILAQCGLPADQTIQVGHDFYTMADFVQQVQMDVHKNVLREWSWTLIGLSAYLPTDTQWNTPVGDTWSIERIIKEEIEQDVYGSACGGSHRLIGVAMTLNQHLASGGELEGTWKSADQVLQKAIQDARRLQNPDGSFSTHYFERPGTTPDLAVALSTTGHVLEFLTIAMTDQQLRQPWVQRSVSHLCSLFRTSIQRELDIDCGPLYHAVHGLALYRQRTFGERTYATYEDSVSTQVSQTNGAPAS